MDLFGDLPEPENINQANQDTSSLYNDIGLHTKPVNEINPSLYGELPKQSQTNVVKSSNIDMFFNDEVPSQQKTVLAQSQGIQQSEKRKNDSQVITDRCEKKLKTVKYEIESFVVERQGEREDMHDAHLIIKDLASQIPNLHPSIYRLSLYGVFDGHGGARASRFASENLHKNLRDKFPKGDISAVEKDIKKTLIDAFKKTDDDFLKAASKSKPVWKDGTTAILVLIINDTMYIANIGDSQALLCRYKEELKMFTPLALSIPHNPSLYEERMRIQKQGGHVKDGRVMGVLEVSRSIGDGQYKKLGVTCIPDVKKCTLTENDRYVIIACDGLWKCFEPADSIDFVNTILEDNKRDNSVQNIGYESACNKLANEAVLRFSGDNVTVLLLKIKKAT